MMNQADQDAHKEVCEGLKELYRSVIKPIEKATSYDSFYSSLIQDAEFDALPMVLLVGPYSVGKTSFIKYLLGRDFPGQRIGPEPTTDKFTAIIDGPDDRLIPGNALTVAPGTPFQGLTKYGNGFLTRFEGSQCNCSFSKKITLIDSPGVLSGEKQRMGRSYNFEQVVRWFADRTDMIILLFDANKLDISDEMKNVILQLKGNEDKVKVVLNKADTVSHQQLMRVYGALMWSLGKVLQTPEVCRVYIGSFWDEPLKNEQTAELLQDEMTNLLADLNTLPKQGAVRRLNELVKRVRLVKVHAHLMGYLREEMPAMFGKEKKKQKLLDSLPEVFRKVQKISGLPPGDFPDLNKFKEVVQDMDFTKFPSLKGRRLGYGKGLQKIDDALSKRIPTLMSSLPGVAVDPQLGVAAVGGYGEIGGEIGGGAGKSNPFG